MRKIILAIVALVFAANVQAQKETFTPEKGNVSVELDFNPFSNNFKTFNMEGLKVRYRFSAKDVVRANIRLAIKNKSTNPGYVEPDATNYSNTTKYTLAKDLYDERIKDVNKDKHSSFGIDLGYERHFLQKKRLDIYAGAQIGFTKKWAKTTTERTQGFINSSGNFWDGFETDKTKTTSTSSLGDAGFGFNAGLFTGIDFYIIKGLYVGAELGFYINTSSAADTESETTSFTGLNNSTTTKTHKYVKNRSFDAAFEALPALRIGWTF